MPNLSLARSTKTLKKNKSLSKLRSIEAPFALLLERSSQLMWLLDSDSNVLTTNQTALNFSRAERPQILHRPIETGWRFSEEEQIRLKDAIASALSGEVVRYNTTISGDIAPVSLSLTLYEIEPQVVLVEGIDVSDNRELTKQLLRTQRLESLGNMTIGIVHDMNNLLTPVLAGANLLRMEFPEANSKQQELFRIVSTQASRASNLLQQMLTFTKGAQGAHPSLIKSDRLVTEIKELIRAILPASIFIRTQLPSDIWLVEGHENLLHQVLVNLCLNARDAMPAGGTLDLSIENTQVDQTDAVVSTEIELTNYIVIQIADTGSGISAPILDQIFKPFFTTKDPGKGTGLGLSTAFDIVQKHGGFIDVDSNTDKACQTGTQFSIYLPAVAV